MSMRIVASSPTRVIPAQAGIQCSCKPHQVPRALDSRLLRRNDEFV